MVIPTVVLKILGGAVAVGALASSVAVPTALSMNSSSEVVLNEFPVGKRQEFKDKCQLLKKEEDSTKEKESDIGYLLACDKESNSVVEFYYYSLGSDPQKFTKLEKQQNDLRSNQPKVKVKTEPRGGVGTGGPDFTASNGDWEDLIGKDLVGCNITKHDGKGKSSKWSVKCPKDDTSKDILLTPVIIQ